MTTRVTIDKLDIKSHNRYAQDQLKLESKYTRDAALIPPHSELLGTSSIFLSYLDQLFEIQARNLPWALFSPPQSFMLQSHRFFTYSILPSICFEDEKEEKENEEEEEKEDDTNQFIKKTLNAQKGQHQSHVSFEEERRAILGLLGSIKMLNKLLVQINSKKLQYQKG